MTEGRQLGLDWLKHQTEAQKPLSCAAKLGAAVGFGSEQRWEEESPQPA